MKVYRCNFCKWKPILFEGNFHGTVKKVCPRCREMNIIKQENLPMLEKFCNVDKIN